MKSNQTRPSFSLEVISKVVGSQATPLHGSEHWSVTVLPRHIRQGNMFSENSAAPVDYGFGCRVKIEHQGE